MFKNKFIYMVFLISITANSMYAADFNNLKKNFKSTIAKVVSIVENKEITKAERNTNIIKEITPSFDFKLMAKISLGKKWKVLTNQEKTDFVKEYINKMKLSYSDKLDAYDNQEVKIENLKQTKKTRVVLETNLKNKSNDFKIVYKFHKPKEKIMGKLEWLIYDVELSGISVLKADRAQFKAFLKSHTIAELTKKLSK